jgi:putative transposase
VHLIRAWLRYASKKDWGPLTKDLRLIYTAVDEQAAEGAMDGFEQGWSARYPSIVKLWRTHWVQFVLFLAFPPEGQEGGLYEESDRVDERPAA